MGRLTAKKNTNANITCECAFNVHANYVFPGIADQLNIYTKIMTQLIVHQATMIRSTVKLII